MKTNNSQTKNIRISLYFVVWIVTGIRSIFCVPIADQLMDWSPFSYTGTVCFLAALSIIFHGLLLITIVNTVGTASPLWILAAFDPSLAIYPEISGILQTLFLFCIVILLQTIKKETPTLLALLLLTAAISFFGLQAYLNYVPITALIIILYALNNKKKRKHFSVLICVFFLLGLGVGIVLRQFILARFDLPIILRETNYQSTITNFTQRNNTILLILHVLLFIVIARLTKTQHNLTQNEENPLTKKDKKIYKNKYVIDQYKLAVVLILFFIFCAINTIYNTSPTLRFICVFPMILIGKLKESNNIICNRICEASGILFEKHPVLCAFLLAVYCQIPFLLGYKNDIFYYATNLQG